MQHYREPFAKTGSCRPIWQYFQEVPIGNKKTGVVERIATYSNQLTQSNIPKLMFYAVPGFITTIETVQWAKQYLPNLTLVDIGEALHYAQESKPQCIADELTQWYIKKSKITIDRKNN